MVEFEGLRYIRTFRPRVGFLGKTSEGKFSIDEDMLLELK